MGGRSCGSRAVYTVDDEGLEEDGTVGRGAGQLVNHSYSRSGTSRGERRRKGMDTERGRGDNLDEHGGGGGGEVGRREGRVIGT